jgi:hypothetical protein
MQFGGDEGWGYLVARDAILANKIPLFGPPTSLGWLRLGPFSYYLLVLALKFGNFHPLSFAFITVFLDSVSILLIYFVAKIYLGHRRSLLICFLYSSSPLIVVSSRIPLYVYMTSFFSLLFYFFWLSYLKNGVKNYLYISFFVLGLLLQTHITPILVFPVFILTIYKKNHLNDYFKWLFFLLLPFMSLLYSEYLTSFVMSKKILLWFPYRILGFFGILSEKNMISSYKLGNIFDVTSRAIMQTVFPYSLYFSLIICIIVLFFLVRKKYFLLFSLLLFSFIGIFLHGQPALHYFTFVLPILILSVGMVFSVNTYGSWILGLIILSNTIFISTSYIGNSSFINQTNLVRKMIEISNNDNYEIVPTPDIINLPHLYDGYRYLGWWLGKEAKTDASVKFMIYEKKYPENLFLKKNEIYKFGNLTLIKLS